MSVTAVAEKCVELRYLCLSNCPLLTDITLQTFAQYSTKLETLEVANCSLFTDAGFQALAKVYKTYF